jgi:HD superfamily phosphodiesterase
MLERMSALRTTIAGIPIPDSTLARDATEFVRDVSSPLLFDHSRRVFLWGSLQGEKLGLDYDPELLYVGAMLHDVGLVEGHRSDHERFEIDGANAARTFLERHGLPEQQVMTVWEQRDGVLAAHPRKDFKAGIIEAFAAGMRDKPATTFGTMNTDVLEEKLPGYVRPNFCELIRGSHFEH